MGFSGEQKYLYSYKKIQKQKDGNIFTFFSLGCV